MNQVNYSVAKIVELVNDIYEYLICIDDIYLASFLADWPTRPFKTRTVSPRSLPVLSYLPELVTDGNGEIERTIKMLESLKEQRPWGQTYSSEDFGATFLEKYGWTEVEAAACPVSLAWRESHPEIAHRLIANAV